MAEPEYSGDESPPESVEEIHEEGARVEELQPTSDVPLSWLDAQSNDARYDNEDAVKKIVSSSTYTTSNTYFAPKINRICPADDRFTERLLFLVCLRANESVAVVTNVYRLTAKSNCERDKRPVRRNDKYLALYQPVLVFLSRYMKHAPSLFKTIETPSPLVTDGQAPDLPGESDLFMYFDFIYNQYSKQFCLIRAAPVDAYASSNVHKAQLYDHVQECGAITSDGVVVVPEVFTSQQNFLQQVPLVDTLGWSDRNLCSVCDEELYVPPPSTRSFRALCSGYVETTTQHELCLREVPQPANESTEPAIIPGEAVEGDEKLPSLSDVIAAQAIAQNVSQTVDSTTVDSTQVYIPVDEQQIKEYARQAYYNILFGKQYHQTYSNLDCVQQHRARNLCKKLYVESEFQAIYKGLQDCYARGTVVHVEGPKQYMYRKEITKLRISVAKTVDEGRTYTEHYLGTTRANKAVVGSLAECHFAVKQLASDLSEDHNTEETIYKFVDSYIPVDYTLKKNNKIVLDGAFVVKEIYPHWDHVPHLDYLLLDPTTTCAMQIMSSITDRQAQGDKFDMSEDMLISRQAKRYMEVYSQMNKRVRRV